MKNHNLLSGWFDNNNNKKEAFSGNIKVVASL